MSLEVLVVGTAGTGKSTVCKIIADALEAHGIKVSVKLTDGLTLDDIDYLDVRASSVAARHDSIPITEVQSFRIRG